MARFRGTVHGKAKIEASRIGQCVETNIYGWTAGVKVTAHVGDNGRDIFTVYSTKGARNTAAQEVLAMLESPAQQKELPNETH